MSSTPPPPNATASISISPAAVTPGQSATLTWSSTNATGCTATGAWSGSQAASGATTVILQGTGAQTYTITCNGAGLPGQNAATLNLSPTESCTTAHAVRAHGYQIPRAVAAARRAVATGTSGPKKGNAAP